MLGIFSRDLKYLEYSAAADLDSLLFLIGIIGGLINDCRQLLKVCLICLELKFNQKYKVEIIVADTHNTHLTNKTI